MVVDDFNVIGIAITPAEADSPLVIYSDAVLPLSVACQTFQTIAGHS